MDELNGSAPKDASGYVAARSPLAPYYFPERMRFDLFCEKYSQAVEYPRIQFPFPELEHEPLPIPEYDHEAQGWVVPGRPDLGVKNTDLPLWTALAKELGVRIYYCRRCCPKPGQRFSVKLRHWVFISLRAMCRFWRGQSCGDSMK